MSLFKNVHQILMTLSPHQLFGLDKSVSVSVIFSLSSKIDWLEPMITATRIITWFDVSGINYLYWMTSLSDVFLIVLKN